MKTIDNPTPEDVKMIMLLHSMQHDQELLLNYLGIRKVERDIQENKKIKDTIITVNPLTRWLMVNAPEMLLKFDCAVDQMEKLLKKVKKPMRKYFYKMKGRKAYCLGCRKSLKQCKC